MDEQNKTQGGRDLQAEPEKNDDTVAWVVIIILLLLILIGGGVWLNSVINGLKADLAAQNDANYAKAVSEVTAAFTEKVAENQRILETPAIHNVVLPKKVVKSVGEETGQQAASRVNKHIDKKIDELKALLEKDPKVVERTTHTQVETRTEVQVVDPAMAESMARLEQQNREMIRMMLLQIKTKPQVTTAIAASQKACKAGTSMLMISFKDGSPITEYLAASTGKLQELRDGKVPKEKVDILLKKPQDVLILAKCFTREDEVRIGLAHSNGYFADGGKILKDVVAIPLSNIDDGMQITDLISVNQDMNPAQGMEKILGITDILRVKVASLIH